MNMQAARSIIPQGDTIARSGRAQVREERLRATVGIEGSLSLSSWRGRSGRRYVVGIHGFGEIGAEDLMGAVLIAVRRDRLGIARVIDVAYGTTDADEAQHCDDVGEAARTNWLDAMRCRGAQEVHIHLLATDDTARQEIAQDLR
jgi:hypothetical protein